MEFRHPLDTNQTLKYIIEEMDKQGIILLGFIVMAKNNTVCPSIFTYVEEVIEPEILIAKLKETCEMVMKVYALRRTIKGDGE